MVTPVPAFLADKLHDGVEGPLFLLLFVAELGDKSLEPRVVVVVDRAFHGRGADIGFEGLSVALTENTTADGHDELIRMKVETYGVVCWMCAVLCFCRKLLGYHFLLGCGMGMFYFGLVLDFFYNYYVCKWLLENLKKLKMKKIKRFNLLMDVW